MREIIERIKSKFGMSATLTVYMDGSGHITWGVFSNDADFESVSFQSSEELNRILWEKTA